MNNWYVVTGGPVSGKTTLLQILKSKGHQTVPEAARFVIDHGLSKGLTIEQVRGDHARFQKDIIDHGIVIEQVLDPSDTLFLDRSMYDNLAYCKLQNIQLDDDSDRIIRKAYYKKVFLLDPLDHFEKDYARIESVEVAAQINELLYEVYDAGGMTPIRVPALSIEERAQFILDRM